jgi:predicted RNase H-like HicB family nuclease
MLILKIECCEFEDAWVGYLCGYPDYWTQGLSLDDLQEHLRDLYFDLLNGILADNDQIKETDVTEARIAHKVDVSFDVHIRNDLRWTLPGRHLLN